ncbi:MAG: hypothetical protein V8R62_14380 [Faecalibacillus intestinalis]
MKNREKIKYYIGVDIGTNSVGWAVIDENGNLLKKGKHHLWGITFNSIKLKLLIIVEIIVLHVEDIIREDKELDYCD